MQKFASIQNNLFNVSVVVLTLITCFARVHFAEAQGDEISLASIYFQEDILPDVTFDQTGATALHIQTGVSLSILTLDFNYVMDSYVWDKLDKLPFGNGKDDPWKTLHMLSLEGVYGSKLNARWSYFLKASGSAAFEEHLDSSYLDSSLGAGALYTLSDTWNLIGGAGLQYTSAPDEVTPAPIVGIQWNMDL